ncbi:enoyl-CoA hydratase/isomerase family protein [Rhizorhabdus dicambivorans]|nr:enoyl-CoA hydratase-related protein [Rhizorhabdus dicambivorans]
MQNIYQVVVTTHQRIRVAKDDVAMGEEGQWAVFWYCIRRRFPSLRGDGSAGCFRKRWTWSEMSQFDTLEISRRGRVVTLAFDRPAVLNAFDATLHTEFPRALAMLAAEDESDVIILTGNGRAFCAGGDFGWQQSAADDPGSFAVTVREAKQIVFGILDCEKPIIARINGPAVGLGATIALLSDIIFIAESAYISDPHVNVGMVAGDGGAVIWPQLIGFARAKEFLFTGDRIGSLEAARIGLVNHVVPDGGLAEAVDAFADRLASGAQSAIRYTKATINVALRQLASTMMDVGLGYESLTNVSRDHQEALAAIRDKRRPLFGAAFLPEGAKERL